MFNYSKPPWKIEVVYVDFHGYENWETFSVRSKENYCLAIVGEVDRATESVNLENAVLMGNAAEMFDTLRKAEAALFYAKTEGEFDLLATTTDVNTAHNAIRRLMDNMLKQKESLESRVKELKGEE